MQGNNQLGLSGILIYNNLTYCSRDSKDKREIERERMVPLTWDIAVYYFGREKLRCESIASKGRSCVSYLLVFVIISLSKTSPIGDTQTCQQLCHFCQDLDRYTTHWDFVERYCLTNRSVSIIVLKEEQPNNSEIESSEDYQLLSFLGKQDKTEPKIKAVKALHTWQQINTTCSTYLNQQLEQQQQPPVPQSKTRCSKHYHPDLKQQRHHAQQSNMCKHDQPHKLKKQSTTNK